MPVSGTAADEAGAAVSRLEAAWRSFRTHGDVAALEPLSRAVQTLRMLAQSARHRRLAGLAATVEAMLHTRLAAESVLEPEFRDQLDSRLATLAMLARLLPRAEQPVSAGAGECVVVLERDGSVILGDWRQIAHFGYRLVSVPDVPSLLDRLAAETVRAIIIDLDCLPGGLIDARLVDALYSAAGREPALIAVSRRSDMRRRLAAARAGVDRYHAKPMDPIDLVEELDGTSSKRSEQGLRIVLVDDNPEERAHCKTVLRQAGMTVTALADPMRVLDVLAEHTADLILLDMYMPGCNGRELARVIRQVPEHASIPIVFLSAEMTLDRRLDAMSLGADDFLVKPINAAHLIRTVEIRAERARTLRSFMVIDHLTGLLNHTRVKEQLKSELAAAERRGAQVAFVMIDIDHFKRVNDSYGHPVGDRVIKTLSRVLRQRLRRTDLIGRYGGEEFAVIMPDTPVREALRVMDEVRAEFAGIQHVSSEGEFSVTFSAGVAGFPEAGDLTALTVRADEALYAAKQAGRNRIMVAIA